MEIRPATLDDGESLTLLATELGYPTTYAELLARLRPLLESTHDAVLVAEGERGVIGWVHVFGARRVESGSFAEIGGLVVASSERGKGVGRRLLAACEAWARGHGLGSMRIRSRTHRHEAHRFYVEHGYDLVKTQAIFVKDLE